MAENIPCVYSSLKEKMSITMCNIWSFTILEYIQKEELMNEAHEYLVDFSLYSVWNLLYYNVGHN